MAMAAMGQKDVRPSTSGQEWKVLWGVCSLGQQVERGAVILGSQPIRVPENQQKAHIEAVFLPVILDSEN